MNKKMVDDIKKEIMFETDPMKKMMLMKKMDAVKQSCPDPTKKIMEA